MQNVGNIVPFEGPFDQKEQISWEKGSGIGLDTRFPSFLWHYGGTFAHVKCEGWASATYVQSLEPPVTPANSRMSMHQRN